MKIPSIQILASNYQFSIKGTIALEMADSRTGTRNHGVPWNVLEYQKQEKCSKNDSNKPA
jgi:hypothetical protein